MGGRGYGGRVCIAIHCHHQNDSCIKMGSYGNCFNVSLTVGDNIKSQDSGHTPQLLKRKESRKGFEPRSFCLPA